MTSITFNFPQGNSIRHSPRSAYDTGSVLSAGNGLKNRRETNDGSVNASSRDTGERSPENAAGAEIGLFCENKRGGRSPRSLPLSGCAISNESGGVESRHATQLGSEHMPALQLGSGSRGSDRPALTLTPTEASA